MTPNLLIYGVTGYTGALISRTAAATGLRHIVAGRNRAKVETAAQKVNESARIFDVTNPTAIAAALEGIQVVLNCAGPFSVTCRPLAAACIRAGVHYLDLAGEVAEYEIVRALDAEAAQAGVMLMPGVGFGIVPTDCAAALVKQQLPDATHLALAFETIGGVSQGTLKTLLAGIHQAGWVRRNGQLETALPAATVRRIDLGNGIRTAVLNPWRGDISTACDSTRIPNIEAYTVFPGLVRWLMTAGNSFLSSLTVRVLSRIVGLLPEGPNEKQLAQGKTFVWAEAKNERGQQTVLRLTGPEAYRFTAATAVEIACRVSQGQYMPGFQTPTRVFGPDFVRKIEGVQVFSE
ncbi:MAG: saccharopine dehydrogenase NADP-binding domain-containing protein [Blastocatellia bacterium]|nr:saccharopine dehydrogenase NADP-binding domain-containing protein [Blastocatellia bacterium]